MSRLQDKSLLADDLEAVAAGEISALRRVYQSTSRELFSICYRVTQSREAAEDVLQEVYIKVWNRAAGYDPNKSSGMAWLAMIARNSAIDWYRAQNRHETTGDDVLKILPDDSEPVDDRLAREQEGKRAFALVGELDDPTSEYIREAYLRGLSYSEVAERAGVPLGTVKSRIRRGLIRLKERMSDG